MSAAPRDRVLLEFSTAAESYAGIAQDLRIIFDMLADLPEVDLAGLLLPVARHDVPRFTSSKNDAARAAGILHWMARKWDFPKKSRLLGSLRTNYHMVPVGDGTISNAIWRVLFGNTLPPDRRIDILRKNFYATDLSVMGMMDRSMSFPSLAPKKLHAENFDYVLFGMPRAVRVPAGVRLLFRFHDAVPITDTDTVSSWWEGLILQRALRQSGPEAIYVCNSPASAETLARIEPELSENVRVIPCALLPYAGNSAKISLETIIEGRRTFRAIGSDAPKNLPPFDATTPYILAVSTLEPRKNYPGLISAWERVVHRVPDLRLVIVGNGGWREEAILKAMAPHVRSGRIIHLENVPTEELWTLRQGASCFVFPSFNEGFGYPPLEALQEGTPCIVSDIPVLRWTLGDAALFVDPYDVKSVADAITRLVGPEREALRNDLLAKRSAVLDRFERGRIQRQWASLLETCRSGRTRVKMPATMFGASLGHVRKIPG